MLTKKFPQIGQLIFLNILQRRASTTLKFCREIMGAADTALGFRDRYWDSSRKDFYLFFNWKVFRSRSVKIIFDALLSEISVPPPSNQRKQIKENHKNFGLFVPKFWFFFFPSSYQCVFMCVWIWKSSFSEN